MSKEDLRKRFRPNLFTQNIHQVENYDPAYEYKNVIFTYRHDPDRVGRYLEAGWEIVETTDNLSDDRSFTPNSKEDKKLRPQPCVTKTKDKHEQVLMRVLKTKRQENTLKNKEAREALRVRNSQRKGETITKKGNEIITKGSEISV